MWRGLLVVCCIVEVLRFLISNKCSVLWAKTSLTYCMEIKQH
jgi:hypothetical protein